MLRPATPLSILLLVSFILLLLSTISAPVVHSIPLATFEGYSFGVFGYCKGSECSSVQVGYTTDGLFGNTNDNGDFNLPASARHSLSSILIVHPVAAFCNLVCLALAVAAHFHSPSHSARFLLSLLILLLPTLLITLLAFLVDILLFVPHLQWAGWIVLASTILITASGVVTCAMRRTLVSRKARKKRIAENAEMSGENFYSRQAQETKTQMPPPLTAGATAPMASGGPSPDGLPSFTTFDASRARNDEVRGPASSVPGSSTAVTSRENASDRQYGISPSRSRSRPPQNAPRDEYGNPLPLGNGYGGPLVRNRSEERRGQGPYREDVYGAPRGGYGPPRGRGGYTPRGSYGPRGGYSGPTRGGPSQGYNGRGGWQGPPARGYSDRGRGGFPVAAMAGGVGGALAAGAVMDRGPRQPPPDYPPSGPGMYPDQNPRMDEYQGPVSRPTSEEFDQRDDVQHQPISPQDYTRSAADQYVAYGARAQSPGRPPRTSPYGSRRQSPAGGVRQPSLPPPVPTMSGPPPEIGGGQHLGPIAYQSPGNPFIEQDADVQGMVGLQQNRQGPESQNMYAQDEYIPPRRNWAPMHHAATISNNDPGSASAPGRHEPASPIELAAAGSVVAEHGAPHSSGPNRPRVNSGGSDIYYEDVNPRFASELDPVAPLPAGLHQDYRQPQGIPGLLQAGGPQQRQFGPSAREEMLRPVSDNLDPAASYEDLQPGARSPAESETSNFTSVSQRGVNPNWRPGADPQGAFGQYAPGRKPVGGNPAVREQQIRRDVLLSGNPDFEIPGMGPARRGRGAATMGRP